jgi:hypothetical protein
MYGTYYNDHFPSEVMIKVNHGCLICGQEFLFDSLALKKHLVAILSNIFFSSYKPLAKCAIMYLPYEYFQPSLKFATKAGAFSIAQAVIDKFLVLPQILD